MSVLEKFKLVELITSRTDSVATFMNGNQIKFNAATFVDLGYPEYIQLFVEEKGKQFAIKACKADAPQAIKFSKPAGEQRYPIKISCAPAANAVRRVMQWAPEESWNVPGAIFGKKKLLSTRWSRRMPQCPRVDGRPKSRLQLQQRPLLRLTPNNP